MNFISLIWNILSFLSFTSPSEMFFILVINNNYEVYRFANYNIFERIPYNSDIFKTFYEIRIYCNWNTNCVPK